MVSIGFLRVYDRNRTLNGKNSLMILVTVTKTIAEIDRDFILRGNSYDTSTFSSDGSDHPETKTVQVCNLYVLLILCAADFASVLTLSRRFNTRFSELTEYCSERFLCQMII